VVNGVVKTSGAVAAVYAVDPAPNPVFIIALFCMFFFWEIGGQNIPNDWTDIAADRKWGAATIPVRFTPKQCQLLIMVSLLLTLLFCRVAFGLALKPFGALYLVLAAGVGVGLLIWPAIRLLYLGSADAAMVLFNRASYYPMALLGVVIIKIMAG
jgi:4-hydroxybenzoate polyprenyltransferase